MSKSLNKRNLTSWLKHINNNSIYAINYTEIKGFHNTIGMICVENLNLKTNVELIVNN